MERDENFVPRTRSYYGLPAQHKASAMDYREAFEEAPLYTLVRMLFMLFFGLQAYFASNALGSPMYPPGTNVCFPSVLDHEMLTN